MIKPRMTPAMVWWRRPHLLPRPRAAKWVFVLAPMTAFRPGRSACFCGTVTKDEAVAMVRKAWAACRTRHVSIAPRSGSGSTVSEESSKSLVVAVPWPEYEPVLPEPHRPGVPIGGDVFDRKNGHH